MEIGREISKGLMFIVIWLLPPATSLLFHDTSWNWLWIGSLILTFVVLGHFEDLEKITYGRKSED